MKRFHILVDHAPVTREKDAKEKKKWTVQIAKQWKKMQPGSSNMQAPSYPEGGSIGKISIECCFPSSAMNILVVMLCEGAIMVSWFAFRILGIPLDECPTSANLDQESVLNVTLSCSSNMDNVPLIVKICTSIVEQKGLEIVGIYRIPGNNASVTHLTELVNKGSDVEVGLKLMLI